MGTRPVCVTNARLEEAKAIVLELIVWADEDAEHAAKNDARETATDDRKRARVLRRALALLRECDR